MHYNFHSMWMWLQSHSFIWLMGHGKGDNDSDLIIRFLKQVISPCNWMANQRNIKEHVLLLLRTLRASLELAPNHLWKKASIIGGVCAQQDSIYKKRDYTPKWSSLKGDAPMEGGSAGKTDNHSQSWSRGIKHKVLASLKRPLISCSCLPMAHVVWSLGEIWLL
jgi:hypothetical protein